MIFHTLSLGELCVGGFFLLSGFLVTKSAKSPRPMGDYFSNRVRRIVPAYAVAYLLCAFVLATVLGASPWRHLGAIVLHFMCLSAPPLMPHLLSGLPYPALNGSMWTIAYEFGCYVLVGALAAFGLLARRRTLLVMTAVLLMAAVVMVATGLDVRADTLTHKVWFLIGRPSKTLVLGATFLVGACAYLYWDVLEARLDGRVVLASALMLAGGLLIRALADASLAVFGGAILFWLAMKAKLGPLQRINDRWDISYGTYLYGWPVAITILYFDRSIGPVVLAAVSLPIAMALGAVSWFTIEKAAKTAFRRKQTPLMATAAA